MRAFLFSIILVLLPIESFACNRAIGIPLFTLTPDVYIDADVVMTGTLETRTGFDRKVDYLFTLGATSDYITYNLSVTNIFKGTLPGSIVVIGQSPVQACPDLIAKGDEPYILYLKERPGRSGYYILNQHYDTSELEEHEKIWQEAENQP